MSWSISLACPASSAEGIPGSLVSSRRRLALAGRERLPARAGRAERSQVTAVATVVRTRDGQAVRLAGRRRGVGCHARPAPRQGSPSADGNYSICGQLARGLSLQRAHHAGYASAGPR